MKKIETLADRERLVYEFLAKHGASSAAQINEACGTTEARKAVSLLNDSGIIVRSAWESGLNRFGHKVRYKLYWLG